LSDDLNITSLRRDIIRTLAYYDIFSYPLTATEVYHNLRDNHTSLEEVQEELEKLSANQVLHRKREFYLLNNNDTYIKRREKGNVLAKKRLKTAQSVSGFISRFPFIRGILLSGSISKGFMEEDSDIDYFVITHPNRVWFSRLMLMLFKKIFLFNSKKIFCINYFVDSENLEIQEKNVLSDVPVDQIYNIFKNPEVTDAYDLKWRQPKREKLTEFLCEEHDFAKNRIENAIERLEKATDTRQSTMDRFF